MNHGLRCVELTLVLKSVQKVIISGVPPRDFVNTIRREKIEEVNELLNRMLQFNIQSLLNRTRFGLGHHQKPVEYEILSQRSPSLN